MALISAGVENFEDIESLGVHALAKITGNVQRAEALLAAISYHTEFSENRLASAHEKVAEKLGISEIVANCTKLMGTDYEDAIVRLLECEKAWTVSVRDDGNRHNEPDLLLRLKDVAVLLEIKTASRKSGLIKKEGAFAVMQKASDYSHDIVRVTLGKPKFDATSKTKVAASHGITLVEHDVFMEAVFRVLTKEVTPEEFLDWLTKPGEAEFKRIPGKPTILLT